MVGIIIIDRQAPHHLQFQSTDLSSWRGHGFDQDFGPMFVPDAGGQL